MSDCNCKQDKCICFDTYKIRMGSESLTEEEVRTMAENWHKMFNRHRVGSRVITLKEFDE